MSESKKAEIKKKIEQIQEDLRRRMKATKLSEFAYIHKQTLKQQQLEEELAALDET